MTENKKKIIMSIIFSKDEYIVYSNCVRHMLQIFYTSEQVMSKTDLKGFINNRCGLFASEDATSYSMLEQLLEKEMDLFCRNRQRVQPSKLCPI